MTSSKGVASINCCSPIGDRLVLNQSRSGLVKLWDHIVLTDLDLLQSRPSQMGPKDPIGMGDAIYNEVHRPRFHFTARENWLNDPDGLAWVDREWHLFFQHNPKATVWGDMTGARAVSENLIHWHQTQHALYPDALGAMYPGSAVVDHEDSAGFGQGAVLAFYTAAGEHAKPEQPYT